MPSARSKKKTSAWYRRKCVEWAKAEARKIGHCEYCGATKEESQLQGSHVMPEEYRSVCADPDNILCLCANSHKFKKHAWHKGPEIAVWFFTNQRERYNRLLEAAHFREIPDWKTEYEKIKAAPD